MRASGALQGVWSSATCSSARKTGAAATCGQDPLTAQRVPRRWVARGRDAAPLRACTGHAGVAPASRRDRQRGPRRARDHNRRETFVPQLVPAASHFHAKGGEPGGRPGRCLGPMREPRRSRPGGSTRSLAIRASSASSRSGQVGPRRVPYSCGAGAAACPREPDPGTRRSDVCRAGSALVRVDVGGVAAQNIVLADARWSLRDLILFGRCAASLGGLA